MSKNRIGIILLLLLLTVGFATVTANLIINNNANISATPDDFSVIFTSANAEEGGTADIDDTKQVITYSTKELKNIGDRAELNYTVKNNSSQYDAEIDMDISFDNTYASYFRITYETFDDTNTVLIDAKEEKSGKIIIELIKYAIDDMHISMEVGLNANAVGRTSIAHEDYTVRFNGNGNTSGSMDDQTIRYNESTALSENTYSKTNYTFAGWATQSNGEQVYKNKQEVLNIIPAGETIELYAIWAKTVTDFSYLNSNQTYNIIADGVYKLEVWGAEGGFTSTGGISYANNRGFGGYAYGDYTGTKGTILNINTGGTGVCGGSGNGVLTGGYNGGGYSISGSSDGNPGCSGGGATHIATASGQLYTLSSNTSSVLIVAGGGGGVGPDDDRAGAGGGFYGGNGTGTGACNGHGATQTGLRNDNNCTTNSPVCFGRGISSSLRGGGGGGGWYGGDVGASDNTAAYNKTTQSCTPFSAFNTFGYNEWSAGGGGGSGYLNPSLNNKGFYCYTGCSGDNTIVTTNKGAHIEKYANTGTGYARITIVSID